MSNVLSSDIVGTDIPPAETHITLRRLMSYAASLGATEDVYLNDLRDGGIVGLPTSIVISEWQVMNGESYRSVLGADNAQIWRCIHVQQDSKVFQCLRPDIHVTTSGKICVLRQTRIGAYIAVRLDTSAADTGEAIAESWFCGIFLGDNVEGPDRSILEPPDLGPIGDEFIPDVAPMLTVSHALPHLYSEAATIWNPIHTERSAARQAGLDDTILHGTCTWGAAGLWIVRNFADGDPTRLTRLGARMTGKAFVGSELFMRHRVIDIHNGAKRVSFQVVDADNRPVLSNGLAEIDL
ncbi:MaoC like domain-containing protein [Salinihabitans flavidus]|uniref:MaoC like domain-containing protein n=2 Tax=Salinihabitans flavidus TaxID=569882 RepID=A0A1H8P3R7_9RHOB|nr:MaoC like domain-containing protein [Salinihabitans flavidus]